MLTDYDRPPYLSMSDQTETSTKQNIHESVNKRNVIFSLYKE